MEVSSRRGLMAVFAVLGAWVPILELKVLVVPGLFAGAGGRLRAHRHRGARRRAVQRRRLAGAARAGTRGCSSASACSARLVPSSRERWDGTGYPDRLAEQDIPLGARVVSVIDAFDAMT